MRILLGADQYPEYINGAANFTARLAEGLAGRGHIVDLIWPSADGRHHSDLQNGVRIHRLTSIALPAKPRMHVSSPWTSTREIESIMQISRPDIVHVQSHLSLGRSLVRIAKAGGVPVMATNHFMPENLVHHLPVVRRFPGLAARIAWRDLEQVFQHADLISAPTQRAVELLASATDLGTALAISCGIDLGRYADLAPQPPEAPFTVLFVGRLEAEKHVDELIRAFARIPRTFGARLEIVGMGSLRPYLEKVSTDLGIKAQVTFAGAISEDDLVQAYGRADVFVMPGTAELQSLATLEAMAAGNPILAADAMALPHLVRDDDNGYLYPPGDVPALSRALLRLMSEPALRHRLGRASVKKAQQHSLSHTLATFERCYRQIVGGQTATVGLIAEPRLALAS